MDIVLDLQQLSVFLGRGNQALHLVDKLSLQLKRGETCALLGESGCGKSMTALAIMQVLPPSARVQGAVCLHQKNLFGLSEQAMRQVRGRKIAMIFQEPMTSLNPVLSIAEQIAEVLQLHFSLDRKAQKARTLELLTLVGIADPLRRMQEYPHQLSGGMKQRVMIAIALACEPEVLIADEPTTALDVTIQAQILSLLKSLQDKTDMAILLITHDLGVVAQMADDIAVMYAGQIVEKASRKHFFQRSLHPYSEKLFQALPTLDKRNTTLTVIPGNVPLMLEGFSRCRFLPRCQRAMEACKQQAPDWYPLSPEQGVRCYLYADRSLAAIDSPQQDTLTVSNAGIKPPAEQQPLLQVHEMKVHFPLYKGIFKRIQGYVYAVDGVSLQLKRGESLALVGESGCGKTTVGKAILQLVSARSGSIHLGQQNLCTLSAKALRSARKKMQIIFQDPFSSLNPRMSIADILDEGLQSQGKVENAEQQMLTLLERVGLDKTALHRYPHEFSGGQRQRIGIARAISLHPDLLVCDEPTSALDVSVQAQILNLLKTLQRQYKLSYLFITHNISVVSWLADRVAVMYLGRIVEQGLVEDILHKPRHPYTQALLASVPDIENTAIKASIQAEMPSAQNRPAGCFFHPRCPKVQNKCKQQYPDLVQVSESHSVQCFYGNS